MKLYKVSLQHVTTEITYLVITNNDIKAINMARDKYVLEKHMKDTNLITLNYCNIQSQNNIIIDRSLLI